MSVDLESAVKFICRHSVQSQERTSLIRNITRSYVAERDGHTHLSKERVEAEVSRLMRQFALRGYV